MVQNNGSITHLEGNVVDDGRGWRQYISKVCGKQLDSSYVIFSHADRSNPSCPKPLHTFNKSWKMTTVMTMSYRYTCIETTRL